MHTTRATSRRLLPLKTGLLGLCGLFGLGVLGCSTDRTVTQDDARYACTTSDDCVTGYGCACGFCQPVSAGQVACLADAGEVDAGKADAGPTDTGSTGPCNVLTWAGCAKGEGCYWDDAVNAAVCLPHGSLGVGKPCEPAKLTQCGRTLKNIPLLCDALDSKCLPLCSTAKAKSCSIGLQCYGLEDKNKNPWPNNAGVCAK